MAKSKNWCFTWNNYTDEELKSIPSWLDHAKGIAYSHEVGESGTPHLQGYICFANAVRLHTLKEVIDPTPRKIIHWEIMKGSLKQNEKYCSKQGELVTLGKREGRFGRCASEL